jgi:hypothetical protein
MKRMELCRAKALSVVILSAAKDPLFVPQATLRTPQSIDPLCIKGRTLVGPAPTREIRGL